jgi:hypothetical protein
LGRGNLLQNLRQARKERPAGEIDLDGLTHSHLNRPAKV